MASGVPIVASRIPSFGLYLENGKNAVLCNPDDPTDLALRIQEVLSDVSLANGLVRVAREQATEHTWEKRADSILSFVQSTT